MTNYRSVHVELGDRSYPVEIGSGIAHRVREHLPATARKVAIVTQANIGVELETGLEQRVFTIGDGEAYKTIGTVGDLCREWAQWGLNRNDVVIGLGGGIVTDVAGFAAAVFHRGLPVVQVATTLLGQVDAAIGGKTGVNLPEGKNLVGAFWQPKAVICDVAMLDSLPQRHYRAGLGEMAKYHFLDDGAMNALAAGELVDGRLGPEALIDRVEASVAIKAAAVVADEREGGLRALLNYGHTLGHALETVGDHELLHGEAVGIGIGYAAAVAKSMGRIDDERVDEHQRVLDSYGLASQPQTTHDFGDLLAVMQRDKKALTSLTFILDGPRGCEVVNDVEIATLETSYEAWLS